MRRIASAIVMAVFFAAHPGRAFDVQGADIIGLRLGMQEAEIVARLTHQGFRPTHTPGTITAFTKDGQIRIGLLDDGSASQIRYVFGGNGAGEAEKIKDAIIERFGLPDRPKPMSWCRTTRSDGVCSRDVASLTFYPESLTLWLRFGDVGQP
jgi:hypothetical protein